MRGKYLVLAIVLGFAGIIAFRAVTRETPKLPAEAPARTGNLRHVVFAIDGMYCAACPYNVENALKDLRGVVNATVGFVGREVVNGTVEGRGEVVYDATAANPDAMIRAILPYKGKVLSDEATGTTELPPLPKTPPL